MTPVPDHSPNQQPHDLPVVLRVDGRQCLVVGGGSVAERKARALVAAGARVTVVAPQVVDTLVELATTRPALDRAPPLPSDRTGSLEIARRTYQGGEAARYDLVVTATGRAEVDRA